jgi:lysophospholipase L1-like esterase
MLALAGVGQAAPADLSRLVVVGDSLMAGYQNGSLRGSQQVHGIAALIAQQAGVTLSQPLMAEPGIPNALTLVDPGPPPIIARLPGTSTGRMNPLLQPFNLAVPGHSVQDALVLRPDFPIDSLTDLILGLPGLMGRVSRSQVEWAEALNPTTILVWVGPNDTLGAALEADASLVTPEAVFEASYTELVRRLAATGASLVLANIPDVTVIPYVTRAEDVAAMIGVPLTVVGPVLGIGAGDFVTPDALPLIEGILTGSLTGPLPGGVVLTADEVATIRAATARFNTIIAEQANAYQAALVDTHGFLNSMKERGLVVHGQRLTTDFLGGIFSLDGIHPTNTGAAATANEFIAALNSKFAADIPRVNVVKVAELDPLVLPGVGHPACALTDVDKDTVAGLRAVLRHQR